MRRLIQITTLLIAVILGYAIAVFFAPGVVAPSTTPLPGDRLAPDPTTTTSSPTSTVPPPAQTEIYLVWATGGLPAGLVESMQSRFDDLSVVAGDVAELQTAGESVVPLDAVAIDPQAHARFDSSGSLGALGPGTVALGETSAVLRGLEPGDELSVDGVDYEVVAIAPDAVVGAAEVIFSRSDPTSPVVTERYVLVATKLARNQFEAVVREMYDGPAPLRIRTQGETPWLRHGDAVLPQVFIKSALGEFSYSNRSGAGFSPDPIFVDNNIVEAEIPILGTIMCHRIVVEMLQGAMSQLVQEGLGHVVDPAGFAGCWNPRYIRATTGRPAGISRHAWGAAVDLNAPANPVGSAGNQDPRLVEVMGKWGFTWGGEWLVPDPMHFEYGIAP